MHSVGILIIRTLLFTHKNWEHASAIVSSLAVGLVSSDDILRTEQESLSALTAWNTHSFHSLGTSL